MIMPKETIVMLYKKAQEDGDAVRQIKSLAKANNVKATVIKNILIEAGLDVPDHIPTGPMKKSPTVIEAADPVPGEAGYHEKKAAVVNEDFEAAVQEMTGEITEPKQEKRIPMPDVVKDAINLGLESLGEQIRKKEQELIDIQETLNRLKEQKRSVEEYMKRTI